MKPKEKRSPSSFTPEGIRQWALECFGAHAVEKVEVHAFRKAYEDVKCRRPRRYNADGISIAEVAYSEAYLIYSAEDTKN